jgi:hypothetical protein
MQRRPPRTRRLFLIVGALIAAVVLAVSIVIAAQLLHHNGQSGPAPPKAQPPASSQPNAAPSSQPASAPSENASAPGDLAASFAAFEQSVAADIGLAVAPVGPTGGVLTFGEWTSGPAWSTSKIPLVLAALREQPTPTISAAMDAAITRSDNDAAEQVWEGLGDPVTAAGKVQAVLRETGDPTIVESKRIRPQFTAFGQTIWSLSDQVHFLSRAACDPRNTALLELMNRIQDDQQWGIGAIPHARFKGGWGPSTTGKYLVRQTGLIPTPNGTLTVALAAEPASGSFDDGIHTLDKLAQWISSHIEQMPSGNCT